MTYPNGRTITYNYDQSSGRYDDWGNPLNVFSQLTSISDNSGTLQSYGYLGLYTPLQMTDGNGVTETITLDSFGRVGDLTYARNGSALDSFSYTYDANGNVTSRRNNVLTSQSELYTYDGLNRLSTFSRGTLSSDGASISGSTASESWALDALGNWNSSTDSGVTTSRTNNAQNQIATVGGTTLSYDANGNLLSDPDGLHYVYDAWNRLVKATSGSTTVALYTYDPSGRRVTQTEGGVTTALYYSLAGTGQVLEERVGGNATAQYVWAPFYVNQLIERDDQPSGGTLTRRMYAEQDANYNITSLASATGSVLQRAVYSSYGTVTLESAAGATLGSDAFHWNYTFQGGRIDLVTGLIHFGYREYSTALGRWIQQDPAGYVDGLSTYQSDASNPNLYVDPIGLATVVAPVRPSPATRWPLWIPSTVNPVVSGGVLLGGAAVAIKMSAYQIDTSTESAWEYERAMDQMRRVPPGYRNRVMPADPNTTPTPQPEPQPAPSTQPARPSTGEPLPNGQRDQPWKNQENTPQSSNVGEKKTQQKSPTTQPVGSTSSGRPTDKYGNPLGPSGKPIVHTPLYPTRKRAKDATRDAGQGEPMSHPTPVVGDPHFHPTNPDGSKKQDNVHHGY